jgi:hypothetical protein
MCASIYRLRMYTLVQGSRLRDKPEPVVFRRKGNDALWQPDASIWRRLIWDSHSWC